LLSDAADVELESVLQRFGLHGTGRGIEVDGSFFCCSVEVKNE
jgi:hypothetical protein